MSEENNLNPNSALVSQGSYIDMKELKKYTQEVGNFYDDLEELEHYTEELKQYIENMIVKYERAKSEASKEKIRKKVHYLLIRLPFDL